MKFKNKQVFKLLLIILIPLFLLLLSYKLVLVLTILTEPQRLAIDFLYDADLEDEMRSYGAQDDEISHMYDVSNVIKTIDFFFYLFLLNIFFILFYLNKEGINIMDVLEKIFYTSLVLLSFLAFFILISFNFSFTLFHKIFFPQGNWQFSFDSFLITTFPESFFSMTAIRIFILAIVLALVLFAYSKYSIKKR